MASLASSFAAWFADEACTPHPAPRATDAVAYRRQMNMAVALAASKWMEFLAADPARASERLRAWLAETEARAERRGAEARAEAVRLVAGWLQSSTETTPSSTRTG